MLAELAKHYMRRSAPLSLAPLFDSVRPVLRSRVSVEACKGAVGSHSRKPRVIWHGQVHETRASTKLRVPDWVSLEKRFKYFGVYIRVPIILGNYPNPACDVCAHGALHVSARQMLLESSKRPPFASKKLQHMGNSKPIW